MANRMQRTTPRDVEPRWKAAAYARLSREDGAGEISGSVANQLQIIQDFAQSRGNIDIVATYTDDGYSGTIFSRPSFVKMMEDAAKGLFDTIIVKDQSRFGRDYLEVGEWVERRLPAMGVRLYSIADDFDSSRPRDYGTALLFPIKNITNELYAWTTSEKTKASLSTRRRQGICVSNFAPYGYKKDPKNKGHLVIDAEAAAVVRRVFRWRSEGESLAQIAERLNADWVPTPMEYRRSHGSNLSCPFVAKRKRGKPAAKARWQPTQVLRILQNEVYVGTLVQGRTSQGPWGLHESVPLPSDQWDRWPNAHKGIVSAELFRKVQGVGHGSAKVLGGAS